MKHEILNKLNNELNQKITSESQVIFILSRIRKYLEISPAEESKYKYLKFYCNWALHAKIDRAGQATSIIKEFMDGKDNGFLTFDHFKSDLKKFISNNNLPEILFIPENYIGFINILIGIYHDTPVSIFEERKITLIKPHKLLKGEVFSVAFKIN